MERPITTVNPPINHPPPSLRHLSVWTYIFLGVIIAVVNGVFVYTMYRLYQTSRYNARMGVRSLEVARENEWGKNSFSLAFELEEKPYITEEKNKTLSPLPNARTPVYHAPFVLDRNNIPFLAEGVCVNPSSKLFPVQGLGIIVPGGKLNGMNRSWKENAKANGKVRAGVRMRGGSK